jgi:hypothetical protein
MLTSVGQRVDIARAFRAEGATVLGVDFVSEPVAHDTVPYFMERFRDAYTNQLQNFAQNVLHDLGLPIRYVLSRFEVFDDSQDAPNEGGSGCA